MRIRIFCENAIENIRTKGSIEVSQKIGEKFSSD